MRYGLPPFVRPRPRPNFGYEAASGEAMLGKHPHRRLLTAFLRRK